MAASRLVCLKQAQRFTPLPSYETSKSETLAIRILLYYPFVCNSKINSQIKVISEVRNNQHFATEDNEQKYFFSFYFSVNTQFQLEN